MPDQQAREQAYRDWLDGPPTDQDKFSRMVDRTMDPDTWWRVHHWGTKWDACDPEVGAIMGDAEVTIFYMTAWGPNSPWVKTASEEWPSLDFFLAYEEPGMCFSGVFHARAGATLKDVCGDYVPHFDDEFEDDDVVDADSGDPADDEDLPF